MSTLSAFFKQKEAWVFAFLVFVAIVILSYQITRPLIDYDEAIYANVVVDTIKSGNIATLTLSGQPWFEKPPLYFWSAMPIVALFGPHEWAFRIPSIIAAILCLVLTYLLVRHLTGSALAAILSFLLLLFSPWFYFFAIEARLDMGVIAAMLASLLAMLKGWQDKRYFLLFFPLIAVGFLAKSIIALLIIPIVLIYSAAYNKWQWLLSGYLWLGSLAAAAILLPWHIYEALRFGNAFWQSYLFGNLGRVTSVVTGTYGIGDYVVPLAIRMPLWFWLCVAFLGVFLVASIFLRDTWNLAYRELAAPLVSAVFIFIFFTAARTHLGAYVLPAYPFLAMLIAIFAYKATQLGKRGYLVALLSIFLVVSGAYYCFSIPWTNFQDIARFAKDEKQIGEFYRTNHSKDSETLYSMEWGALDTLKFYSGTNPQHVDDRGPLTELRAPFFLVVTTELSNYIYANVPQAFSQFKVVYGGQYLTMLHTDQNMTIGGNQPR